MVRIDEATHRYFVNSYGGSCSTMFCEFLDSLGTGKSWHMHNRHPSFNLTHDLGLKEGRIVKENAECYHSVFLYRRPAYSVFSTNSWGGQHFSNVGLTLPEKRLLGSMNRVDYCEQPVDILRYEEFVQNALVPKRYPTIFVDMERIWRKDNIQQVLTNLNIPAKYARQFPSQRPPKRIEQIDKYLNAPPFQAINKRLSCLPPVVVIK